MPAGTLETPADTNPRRGWTLMNILDLRTVLTSYVISNAICMTAMLSLWRRRRSRAPELDFWLADFVMQFVAVLLLVLRGRVPDLLSIVIASALVMAGTLLLYIGLEQYVWETESATIQLCIYCDIRRRPAIFHVRAAQYPGAQSQLLDRPAGHLHPVCLAYAAPCGPQSTIEHPAGCVGHSSPIAWSAPRASRWIWLSHRRPT